MSTSSQANGHVTGSGDDSLLSDDSLFIQRVVDLIKSDIIEKDKDPNSKVVEFRHPEELKQLMNFNLSESGVNDDTLLDYCRQTAHYSVHTGHRGFFNQLYSGFDRYAVAGAFLTDALNTNHATYEIAPVFTLMEEAVMKHIRDLIGWNTGDGIFCPGGAMSNIYAMTVARYAQFPEVKTKGIKALPDLLTYTHQQSHFSFKKGAILLGMGSESSRSVPCNEVGQMDVKKLEQLLIEAKGKGEHPYFVSAISGSTVLGAYDDISAVADVAQKYGLWLHVDMCWGGGVLVSKKHRHLIQGIERADSVSWNTHKMLGGPLQGSIYVTKHGNNLLQNCYGDSASYIFQTDKFYDTSYDIGDKTYQCSRKVDALKLWLMWKAKGDHGLEQGVDNLFQKAQYFRDLVSRTPGFRLVLDQPQCTNVCFWYIPENMRGEKETEDWWQRLSKVAPIIKQRMSEKGTMLVGYQPLGSKVNFFRFIFANHRITDETVEFVVAEIERLGQNIFV